jgi:hypothetical protein
MPSLATRFALILTGLRAVIARAAARDRARAPLLVLAWSRIGRMAARFERLFALWRAGSLPQPRPPRARRPTGPRQYARLPSGRIWLVALVRDAAPAASQLQSLLAAPDLADFLAACPQAGRILRPLCRMLGVPLTPALRRPNPPAHPQASRPGYPPLFSSPAPLRRFSPA